MEINTIYFPYKFRENQAELFSFIQNNIEEKNIIISAPTGFGKTPLILSSLIPFAKEKFKKIIWTVKTGPETDRPIEELKEINKALKIMEIDEKVFGISIRGKKDMCLLKRQFREEADYEEIAFFCKNKIKNKECKYFERLYDAYVPYQEEPLLYSEVLKFADAYGICPYYYQLYQIYDSDIIAVNYNYIFNEQIGKALTNKINFKDVILVIDEAHNLQFLISGLNFKEITLGTIRKAIEEIENYNLNEENLKKFLKRLENYFLKIYSNLRERNKEDIAINILKLFEYCNSSINSKIEEKLIELGIKVRIKKIREKKAPRSSLYKIGEFFKYAIEMSDFEGVKIIASLKGEKNVSLEIFDMRTAEIYSKIWNKFYRVVFCSGTLGSINSFAEIIGLENYVGKNIEFNLKRENCLAIITSFLTTKGDELPKEMSLNYINAIDNFVRKLEENIAIFSASYRIQETLIKNGLLRALRKYQRKIFIESQDMAGDEVKEMLNEFKKAAYSTKGILIASSTGKFAEGADFPKKELVGIFLVGMPFDRLTTKTYLLVNYYKKIYGRKKGLFYSYILPALRRASHAIGRAIRSPNDKALIILGDKRFKRYRKYLPKFVKNNLNYANNISHMNQLIKKFEI